MIGAMTEISPSATHRANAPKQLRFAVLTISDTRTAQTDRGGPLIAELLAAAGHELAGRVLIVGDDAPAIRDAVRDALRDPRVDVVVTTGGTGLAPRDVTPEAIAPLFSREIPGFGELFRALSYAEIGAAAMLSRAVAGVVDRRLLFALPGSPAAVRVAMEKLVLPEAGHLLVHARPERDQSPALAGL